jgi:type I restriction enzyme, S subunit
MSSAQVPEGYKQTEVGVIPEDWQVRPLLSAISIATGQVDPRDEPYKSMVLVAPDHVETMTGRLLELQTAEDQGAISGKYLFNSGDIIYSKIRPYLRKVILADFRGMCSADMYPLTPAKDVSSAFIFAVLLGHRFSQFAENVSARSGIPKINREELAEYTVALPPLPEQQTIAQALSDVDALIASLDKLIAKQRQIKTAAMQQLLTGKMRSPGFGEGKGYKQTEVGMIPEDWRLATLRELCMFENGDRSSNYPSQKDFVFSGIPFINAGHVDKGQITLISMDYITPNSFNRLGGGKVKAKDILFCLRGSLGKFGVVKDDFGDGAIASSLVIIRPKYASVSHEYLGCYFDSNLCAQMIETWSGGAAQPNLGAQDLARFSILLPSPDEQRAIATVLSDMDTAITALENRRAKTQSIKQGMMQELLTGRTRLV